MFEVEIIASFSAAHRLRSYKGKCERLHGHNYRVHVTARADAPGDDGLVIDFGELKNVTCSVLNGLDHSYLNEAPPFDKIEPSAENIAAHIFQEIFGKLGARGEMLYSVSVWESETSRATYMRGIPPRSV
jgi:6-pyruvoyltetrahydropterin/6-carboxytetrahydropterin synthase